MIAACTRLRRPSFASTRLMCVFAVPSAIPSARAISALDSPRPMWTSNLALTRGQVPVRLGPGCGRTGRRGRLGRSWQGGERLDHPPGDRGGDQSVAACDHPYGLDERVGLGVFKKEADRPGT